MSERPRALAHGLGNSVYGPSDPLYLELHSGGVPAGLTVSLKLLIQRPKQLSTHQDRLSIHRPTKNVQQRPPWPDFAVCTPRIYSPCDLLLWRL